MASAQLKKAKENKKDEFYTSLTDIERELKYYKNQFKNKIVFCNCDDPYESNFFKYFAMNFNHLELKKLIATCYFSSPVAWKQLTLFDVPGQIESCRERERERERESRCPYKIEITEVRDENGDGSIGLPDVEYLIKNRKNILSVLEGDGDFRSRECTELLKEADIICTNPPFSLFREYVAKLIEYEKKFLILGNQNAITYKEIFPLIKDNKMWLGESIHSGDREFRIPDHYPMEASGCRTDENGVRYIRVKGVRWFTNLDVPGRHEELTLYKNYRPDAYHRYDNCDAIEVSKTAEIPCDYSGLMGVPITFLDKYNPEQFEIVRFRKGDDEKDLTIKGKDPYFRILIRRRDFNESRVA